MHCLNLKLRYWRFAWINEDLTTKRKTHSGNLWSISAVFLSCAAFVRGEKNKQKNIFPTPVLPADVRLLSLSVEQMATQVLKCPKVSNSEALGYFTSLFCIALIYWHFSSFACWRPSKISAEFNVLCIMSLNYQRKNNHCLSASPFLTKICDRCLLLEHQIWSWHGVAYFNHSLPPKQCVKSHRSVMIHRSIYLLQSDF